MNMLLFFIVIIISFVVVRIGAIAFELTGLEWSLAKFQALSCFTGTGFTTREAELVTSNPQRRRIATILMILGNAGLVTLIATFANSLGPNAFIAKPIIPALSVGYMRGFIPWINVSVAVVFVYLLFRLFNNSRLSTQLTNFLRKRMVKKHVVKKVSFEELVVATGGYGISQVEVCKDSPVLDKTLNGSGLRKLDISVLAIEREGVTIPNPSASTEILLGDRLICFGKLKNIRESIYVTGD